MGALVGGKREEGDKKWERGKEREEVRLGQ